MSPEEINSGLTIKKKKIFILKKMEQNIIFARISENGNVAVITTSDTYICKLTVF